MIDTNHIALAGSAPTRTSLWDRVRAHARANHRLLKLQVELTRRCNLLCRHCYVSERNGDGVALERWLALVDEAAEQGCMSVSLTGGEVLLRSGWLSVAERVKERGMILSVLSNGTLFDEDSAAALSELKPLSVGVSVYGATPEVHDAVTGVSGSFAKTVDGLRLLRRHGVKCRIGSVLMEDTILEYRRLVALADSLGCKYMFDPTVAPSNDGGLAVTEYRVPVAQLETLYTDEILSDQTREGRLVARGASGKEAQVRNCDAGLTMGFVDASGGLYPCMGFPPSFGNIGQASLAELWNSRVAREHRDRMATPLRECRECSRASFCTARCSRLAVVEDGDLSGRSRRACEIAEMVERLRDRFASGTLLQ